ncbi:MAG: DNA alkylation repair protein [Microgenomates group bacterium]
MNILDDLKKVADPIRAQNLARFFKTAQGQYGFGDIFLGITVPQLRIIAKKYSLMPLSEIRSLLKNPIHECRLTALVILTKKFTQATENEKTSIYTFYLHNTSAINNWDLVDVSAGKIVGEYLLNKDTSILHKLAISKNLWERRIAIIATSTFIAHNQFDETIKIATLLLNDKHDLIHKAVGWMLREAGKRDQTVLISFLDKHSKAMPRTMLRYAIEKLDTPIRKQYMTR